MNETIQVLVNSDELDLPKYSAVYAIFSASKCRFVGVTDNLHQTIIEHFKPTEPNVSLRYFMQSNKPKILQYEVLQDTFIVNRSMIKERWINLYAPTDNQPSYGSLATPTIS